MLLIKQNLIQAFFLPKRQYSNLTAIPAKYNNDNTD